MCLRLALFFSALLRPWMGWYAAAAVFGPGAGTRVLADVKETWDGLLDTSHSVS